MRGAQSAGEAAETETKRLPVVVGITGSSGAALAVRTVEVLGKLGVPMHLAYTPACKQVWPDELGHQITDDLADWKRRFGARVFNPDDFRAPASSGSFVTAGMIIVPCSMRTVAAVASGLASNLVERAADVTIKEGRALVLVAREAPLSAIHLENLLKLARLGVRIVPPVPQFYLRPQTVDEVVDRLARRALAILGIQEALPPEMRWRPDEE
jgi:4-hydroxy-3-polyprenylbenzoate decarboxylase